MYLVEREQHIEHIDQLISRCLAGQGQPVLLDGVATSGKTTLLDVTIDLARKAGMLVLHGTCTLMERDIEASLISQLLHSAALPATTIRNAAASYQAFCTEMLAIAADTPLLIAVDDGHRADPESLRYLLYLARRLGAARLFLLLTLDRTDLSTPASPDVDLLTSTRWCRISVEPITEAGVARMLADRLAPQPAPAYAALFHQLSGGNPVLLNALIEECRRAGGVGADCITEGGYGAAAVRLLRRGGPTMLRLAQALAVLGRNGDLAQATRIADLADPADMVAVQRTAAAMTASGLLRDGWFAHPVVASAVLGTMLGAERAELHRRAASLLYDLGGQAEAIAHHLSRAGRPAPSWGIPVLVEAAEQALLTADARSAVPYLDLAYEQCGEPAESLAILAKLTSAEWRISPSKAAQHLDPLVAGVRCGQLKPTVSPDLVRQLLWHGRTSDASAVLTRLRAASTDDPELAADLHNLESWLSFSFPPLAGRGTTRARTASPDGPGLSVSAGSDPSLALAGALCKLLMRGQYGRRIDQVEQALENLRSVGGSPWTEEVATLALLGLVNADMPDRVRKWADALTARTDPDQAPTWHALVGSLRAEATLRTGDLTAALAGAREALTLLPPHAWGVQVGFPIGTLVTAAVRLGDLREAADHLAFIPVDTMFQSRYGLYYLHARGHYYLAIGRTFAALSDFLACRDLASSLGLDTAVTVPWRTSAAHAWLQLGNEDQARRLVRDQLARAEATGDSNRGRSLRMLAAVSPPDRRPQLLSEALELFEECGDQYEQVHVLTDLGRAYAALGDSRRARTALRRARHLAELCRAEPLCDDLLAPQERDEGPTNLDDDGCGLTESERRVAHLAALGYTNREIAAKLYITPSTVEQHLTRVYRKLDVKQRKDLPARLGTTSTRAGSSRHHLAPTRRLLS